jgi:hypothetical protein
MMEIHLQIIGFKCVGALSNSHDKRSFGSIQNVGDNILVPSLIAALKAYNKSLVKPLLKNENCLILQLHQLHVITNIKYLLYGK